MADKAAEEFGTVDILVNNAGLYPVTPLAELSLAEWETVINTNLTVPSSAHARLQWP
jgi:NADP-dependent 3-hydroxy acid dehydrogenase YdfG